MDVSLGLGDQRQMNCFLSKPQEKRHPFTLPLNHFSLLFRRQRLSFKIPRLPAHFSRNGPGDAREEAVLKKLSLETDGARLCDCRLLAREEKDFDCCTVDTDL